MQQKNAQKQQFSNNVVFDIHFGCFFSGPGHKFACKDFVIYIYIHACHCLSFDGFERKQRISKLSCPQSSNRRGEWEYVGIVQIRVSYVHGLAWLRFQLYIEELY